MLFFDLSADLTFNLSLKILLRLINLALRRVVVVVAPVPRIYVEEAPVVEDIVLATVELELLKKLSTAEVDLVRFGVVG